MIVTIASLTFYIVLYPMSENSKLNNNQSPNLKLLFLLNFIHIKMPYFFGWWSLIVSSLLNPNLWVSFSLKIYFRKHFLLLLPVASGEPLTQNYFSIPWGSQLNEKVQGFSSLLLLTGIRPITLIEVLPLVPALRTIPSLLSVHYCYFNFLATLISAQGVCVWKICLGDLHHLLQHLYVSKHASCLIQRLINLQGT